MELLNSLDFEQLSELHRRVVPMLKMDIIGQLPTELALLVLAFLPVPALLQASLVNHHWHALTDAQIIWKSLCNGRGWRWKYSLTRNPLQWQENPSPSSNNLSRHVSIDEGFTDGDMETPTADLFPPPTSADEAGLRFGNNKSLSQQFSPALHHASRHSFPTSLSSSTPQNTVSQFRPDYKLLFRTRTVLNNRLRNGQFRLTVVNTPSIRASLPANFVFDPGQAGQEEHVFGHTSTIYAICLASDVVTGERTLFTASRDQTILQWKLSSSSPDFASTSDSRTGWNSESRRAWRSTSTSSLPMRVFQGGHQGSVLSICVAPEFGYLVSGGSDGRIVIWDMATGMPLKILADPVAHEDSVLCVRCDDKRLVSCSKGWYTVLLAIYIG